VPERPNAATDRGAERTAGGQAGRLLATLSLGWAVLQAGRFVLAPLLPAIIADLGITEATAGLAFAAFGGVYAVAQYPGGRLSDQWTRATLIVPGLVVLALGFLLVGVATSYLLFVGALVVMGLGKGLYAIPARALVSDRYVERRGRALGVFAAGTDVGGLAASGVAVVVLASASWRAPFVPVAVGLAALTLLFVRWADEPYRVGRPDLELGVTVRRLVASGGQRRTLVAYALFYFMVGGFINFFPTYLAARKGFSESLAAAAFAVVFAVGLAVKPLAGDLSDRFRRQHVAAGGLAVAAAALLALVVADSALAVWGSTVLLAFGYKTQFPLADAIVMDDAPDGGMGADLGAARALFLAASAAGPAYVGVVATYAGYAAAFASLAGALVVAALLIRR
jgi:predicted MFS family arabinose efflux permease